MSEPARAAALLPHLERLHAFAQTLTPDPDEAARLAEAAYRRAAAVPPEARPDLDAKAWLFRLLLEEHGRRAETSGADALDVHRRSLVEAFLNRALPGAFAALPAPERTALVLCEVEGFSCAGAGDVLGLDPVAACGRLDAARATLVELLRAGATPAERPLLSGGLPEGWLGPALRRVVEDDLAPMPPALRTNLEAGAEPPVPPAPTARPALDAGSEPAPEPNRRRTSAVPKRRTSAWETGLGRGAVALAIVLAAGLLGYFFSSPPPPEVDTNVITLSARQTRAVTPTLRTGDAERAERFVRSHLGQRLTLPAIGEAALQGVAIEEVAPDVHVPAFVFADSLTGRPVTLYAYSYALLQRHADRLRLEGDIRRQIEDAAHVDIHDLGEAKVLVWRHRDDIYVAVTQGDAEALRQRIFYPS